MHKIYVVLIYIWLQTQPGASNLYDIGQEAFVDAKDKLPIGKDYFSEIKTAPIHFLLQ